METVKIHTEYIKLDDLLKFAGAVGTGGMAKAVVKEGLVSLNGEICTVRGKKLFGGETVGYGGKEYKVEK